MSEQDKRLPDESRGGPNPTSEEEDVRLTIEQSRRALDASAAEIERSKRLLREIEELSDIPGPLPPGGSSDESGPS